VYFSKTDFKVAQTCPPKLYYKKRVYESIWSSCSIISSHPPEIEQWDSIPASAKSTCSSRRRNRAWLIVKHSVISYCV
jgi:hypothetical protein